MSKKDILLRFGTSTHARELSVREMSVSAIVSALFLNMSKKRQRNLHSLFTMKDLSRSLLTSQKKLRLHPSVKFP